MTNTKTILALSILLSIGIVAGCKKESVSNSNEPRQLSDNSTLQVNTASDGSKTETRTFDAGEVFRATRITRPKADRMVLVELRDGRTAVLKNEEDVAGILDASEEAIASAAIRTIAALGSAQSGTGVTTTGNANAKGAGKKAPKSR